MKKILPTIKLMIPFLALAFSLTAYAATLDVSPQFPSSKAGCTAGLACGLVGYWTFDGKNTNWVTAQTTDSSGSGNTGQMFSMSTTSSPAQGKIGQALAFNGTNQYVDLGSGSKSLLNVTRLVTLSFWAKNNSTTRMTPIGTYNGSGSNLISVDFNRGASLPQTNRLYFSFRDSAGSQLLEAYISSDNAAITDGKWHLYSVSFDLANHLITPYIDGVPLPVTYTQTGTPAATTFANDILVGALNNTGSAGTFFQGSLDDVRIYNRALSAAEIQQLYSMGAATRQATSPQFPYSTAGCKTSLSCGLAGWWTFDGKDISGTTATDRSGNGNIGTLVTAVTSSYVPGKIGQALSFNGINQQVTTTANEISGTSASISFWVNVANLNTSSQTDSVSYMISRGDFSDNSRIYIKQNNSAFDLTLGSTNFSSLFTFSPNTWYHVVVAFSGGTYFLYKNGVQISTGSYAGYTSPGACSIKIAAYNDTGCPGSVALIKDYFNGKMDDVRIYSRVLSASEVQQLYNIGANQKIAASPQFLYKPAGCSSGLSCGLVGYWTFDGKNTNWTANTTSDSSGSGNTGTLVSMSTTTSPVIGKIGQAFNFNGSTQYVNVSNASSLTITGALTLAAWVKYSSAQINKGILGKYDTSASNRAYSLYTANDGVGAKLECTIQASGSAFDTNAQATTTNAYNDGRWHLVVCVFNPSTQLQMYVDGAAAGTNAVTIPSSIFSSTANLQIGTYNQTTADAFAGSIDDARIYNRALSASEIQQLYSMGR